jgi:glutamate/tyrosine decarboxylase-like PLP-dependent enzyme
MLLEDSARQAIWKHVINSIEEYISDIDALAVTPELDTEKIRSGLTKLDFKEALSPQEAIDLAVQGLTEYQVHTPHPGYFGLFNPAPTTMGIAADALVAAFNPQLASWSHSPFANEVERHLIRAFGEKFGFPARQIDGTFTSGGAEANHTALLTALVHSFPDYSEKGLAKTGDNPVFYVSEESHHSFLKAARLSGIGSSAVRVVPVNDDLRMNTESLKSQIMQDKAEELQPFMVVATVGTTNSGVIDPLYEIRNIARENGLWFHADAAWGGAAALVSELCPLIGGIEFADSITFDAHKWLSVPMGAGIYITRHREILSRAFQTDNSYMPGREGLDVIDPYSHSMSWSRRFTGLKVFLSLLVAGWNGYETTIRHQTAMGNFLREKLVANNWEVVNKTQLPVICFVDRERNSSRDYLQKILNSVLASGKAWISTTKLGNGRVVLRACITNYRTTEEDIENLVCALNEAREQSSKAANI